MASRNYLEVEPKRSLLSVVEEPDFTEFDFDAPAPNFKIITPQRGFCVKVKTENNEKVFINLCHCAEVPPPPPSLDVYKIIASGNPDEESLFRFPLSLGALHTELDKSGNECKCYDVVINSDYYKQVTKNSALRDFIMTLACSGLERKYDISLDVGTCAILNKPYHGTMPKHFIRLKPKENTDVAPFDNIFSPDYPADKIEEMDIVMPVKNPTRFISLSGPEITHYDLFQSPASGSPSRLIFQGLTTNVKNKKSLALFVSKRKLTVRDMKCNCLVSVALPYTVVPKKSLSNFWKNRLCVVMPIAPPDS